MTVKSSNHYISTTPCKKGHVGLRHIDSNRCIECRREADRARYYADSTKTKMRTAIKYKKNAEKIKAKRREQYRLNSDKEKAIARVRAAEWRRNNPAHIGNKLAKQRYKASAKGIAANSIHRVARRLNMKHATPKWADVSAISDVYLEARYMQKQVDHIVPLRNKLVCGLHVWDNLQLMDAVSNNKKGNRHWPDMPV